MKNSETVFLEIRQLYLQSVRVVKLLAATVPVGIDGDHRGIPLPTCFGPHKENFLAFTVAGVEIWTTVTDKDSDPKKPTFLHCKYLESTDLVTIEDEHFLEKTEQDVEHMLTTAASEFAKKLTVGLSEIENIQVYLQSQRQRRMG
jgi:hypothetical protein